MLGTDSSCLLSNETDLSESIKIHHSHSHSHSHSQLHHGGRRGEDDGDGVMGILGKGSKETDKGCAVMFILRCAGRASLPLSSSPISRNSRRND